jgi:NAD+ diphosphatase
MPHRLTYAGVPLDRAADFRNDQDWLDRQQRASHSLLLVVWRECNLVIPGDTPKPAFLQGDQSDRVLALSKQRLPPVFLGLQGNVAVFMADLSHLEEAGALKAVGHQPEQAGFASLRSIGPLISQDAGSLLAMARAMAYWHHRHLYCGACGAPTNSFTGGHMRRCSNEYCRIEHFPRTDPAVIMLVTTTLHDQPHCLLGRQASWAEGRYSSLAGFVEPGESLETAVLREVWEESGIRATKPRYLASQPWPFPSSIMLGFTAQALSHDIDVGTNELEDARWFSRTDIIKIDQENYQGRELSSRDSIARWLIDHWVKNS